jgi:hypothetical protein
MNPIRNADAAIKANEIGAAAKQNMLAIIDDLLDTRVQIRASPPAKEAAPLDEFHAKASLGESAGRAHAGDTSADNRDGLLRILLQTGQSSFLGAKATPISQPLRHN